MSFCYVKIYRTKAASRKFENKTLKKARGRHFFVAGLCMLAFAVSAAEQPADGRSPPGQTLILTIGSRPVYEPEFRFRLKYIEKYYKVSHGYDEIPDWSVEQNGQPLREYFLATAAAYACKDTAIEAKADELGIKLSAPDLEEMQTARAANIRLYGSESEYRRIVESMYGSEDVFAYLTKMDRLNSKLFEHLYGAKGEQCSDQCVSAYVDRQGFMAAKYIFLADTNNEGKPLSTAQRRQNDRLLEDIVRQLNASDRPQALFDILMNRFSQDVSLSNYPDGRLFGAGSKGKTFEQAYRQLAVGQHSGIVKAEGGRYIILRMPIFPEMAADAAGHNLRYWVAHEYLFKNQVGNWCAQLPSKYEKAYEGLYP